MTGKDKPIGTLTDANMSGYSGRVFDLGGVYAPSFTALVDNKVQEFVPKLSYGNTSFSIFWVKEGDEEGY